jgi:Tfp pilus assembly protein PilN
VITKINLSSKPFRNRTLPYLISLLLLAIAVAGAVLSFAKWREIADDNKIKLEEIAAMEKELQELKGKGELVQQQLSPEQRTLLVAANKLVANKSFGWSRLFADLEGVLPGSVSASRISVENIYKDGNRIKAELEFAVLSYNYQAVMTMIDNMNNSGVFRAELRGQDLQKTEGAVYSEYTLHLIYTPAYSYSATPTDIASSTDSNEGGTR